MASRALTTKTKKKHTIPDDGKDPIAAAKLADLRYVHDYHPGIARTRKGKAFGYQLPDGKPLTKEADLSRIRALGIPPAWTDVWICLHANGHLQATGRDARGRKQYRYHERWREVRDESKFGRMLEFAKAMPKIRAATDRDLKLHGLPKAKVVATVVRLLETTLIRVGNEEYARDNESYGLTTLRDRHVDVHGATIRFHFRGKSGKEHAIEVRDRRLAKIVHECEEIPGHELFHYVDPASGAKHVIESNDVNAYLCDASGDHFTAKDFRTWAGTVLAARALEEKAAEMAAAAEAAKDFAMGKAPKASRGPLKKHVVDAVKLVASKLGNTPTVARKSYIHPIVIEAYLAGSLHVGTSTATAKRMRKELRDLPESEARVLMLLEAQLARAANETLESKLRESIKSIKVAS